MATYEILGASTDPDAVIDLRCEVCGDKIGEVKQPLIGLLRQLRADAVAGTWPELDEAVREHEAKGCQAPA